MRGNAEKNEKKKLKSGNVAKYERAEGKHHQIFFSERKHHFDPELWWLLQRQTAEENMLTLL